MSTRSRDCEPGGHIKLTTVNSWIIEIIHGEQPNMIGRQHRSVNPAHVRPAQVVLECLVPSRA